MSRFFAAFVAAFLAFSCSLASLRRHRPDSSAAPSRSTANPHRGATVMLEGEGSRFTATARRNGEYVFSQVPFGTYRAHRHTVKGIATTRSPGHRHQRRRRDGRRPALDSSSRSRRRPSRLTPASQANPPSVNQIDRAQIQTSPVQNSLDRLLETLPGVVPFSYNEPVINGFHGVTYNIDGAPLPLATTSNFAEIVDPKIIDSLEAADRRDPGRVRRRPHGRRRQHHQQPARPTCREGFYGTVTGGFGNQAQVIGQLDTAARFGSSEVFPQREHAERPAADSTRRRSIRSTTTRRRATSSSAFITQLTPRSTLAFDYSNQFAQFQIPINTDPNNPYDPIFTPCRHATTCSASTTVSRISTARKSRKTATASFR